MKSLDLTTGSLWSHFRTIAVPAALGMMFVTLYNVVDVWYAGLLGTYAQAGLAISFQVFFLLMAFGIGLSSAMSALVGNALGAKDDDHARATAIQGLSFAVFITLVLFALGQVAGPWLLTFVSEPGEYRDAATRYLRVLLFAMPGFILGFGINGMLQATGDARSNQRAMMAAFFVNIGLNPLFIFGIPGLTGGLGFDGIAAATVISQSAVAVYLFRQLKGTELIDGLTLSRLWPDFSLWAEITRQLVPTASTMVVMIFAGFAVQYNLKAFGEPAVAAYGVALRVEQLILLPALGVTGALLPIAAQNFGAQNGDRVRGALRVCLTIGLIYMAFASPALLLAAPFMMAVFTPDAQVVEIGASYLRIDGFLMPVYAVLFAINSLLQALKQPQWAFWIGVWRQAIAVPLFIWLFIGPLGWDVNGVWLGIATAVTSGLLVSLMIGEWVARPLIGGLWWAPKQKVTG